MSEKKKIILSRILGFDDLILGAQKSNEGHGLPYGSSVLLAGPPGAGKTTFALALTRAAMQGPAPTSKATGDEKTASSPTVVYYISTEVALARLRHMYQEMDWFPATPPKDALFQCQLPDADRNTFYAINTPVEIDRPAPSAEEAINSIIGVIKRSMHPSESKSNTTRSHIVIVDSLTAILRTCPNEREERRQTHELLHRLRSTFGDSLALTFLISESDPPTPAAASEHKIEEYLVDIVLRLYHRHEPLGRRLRALDVVKSQGVHLLPGEHTWQILTQANYLNILRSKHLQDKLLENNNISATKIGEQSTIPAFGTVTIFPRPKSYPDLGRQGKPEDLLVFTGTNGLDAMLKPQAQYWIHPENDVTPGLKKGSTTLIMGPMGSGKSTLCRQFLAAPTVQNHKTPQKTYYITFDLDPAINSGKDDKVETIHFPQTQFDFNRVVMHLRTILAINSDQERKHDVRLVFDGLSEWLSMFGKLEAAKMLESLMLVIAESTCRPTVFMTYDMPDTSDPIAAQTLGIDADYIVIVRQITLHDNLRRIIYLQKTFDGKGEKGVKELTFDSSAGDKKVKVTSGLDYYTNLIFGRPKPASVVLHLFQENVDERRFNKWLFRSLSSHSKLEVRLHSFGRSDIASILPPSSLPPGFISSELTVISLDEWIMPYTYSEAESPDGGSCLPLHDLRALWNKAIYSSHSLNHFWFIEMGLVHEPRLCGEPAASTVSSEQHSRACKEGEKTAILALPHYMDFGLIVVNAQCLKTAPNPNDPKSAPALPRVWAKYDLTTGWFSDPLKQPETIVGWFASHREQLLTSDVRLYAFDSATPETCFCTLLEFAWAFGASEDFLQNVKKAEENQSFIQQSFAFMQYLVLNKMLTLSAFNSTSHKALLTRHFYSTLPRFHENSTLDARERDNGLDDSQHFILRAFPAGTADVKATVRDALTRYNRFLSRLKNSASTGLKQIAAKHSPIAYGNTRADKFPTEKVVTKLVEDTNSLLDGLKSVAICESDYRGDLGSQHSMSHADTLELLRLHMLRMRLLLGESLETVLERSGDDASCLEALAIPNPYISDNATLTGYTTTGSWLLGVHGSTSAVGLIQPIMTHLTSLDAAVERARTGAGLPSRRDFLRLYGHESVRHLKTLSWKQLFRLSTSRARRRERVWPQGFKNQAAVHLLVQEWIHQLCDQAELWRPIYDQEGNPVARNQVIRNANAAADKATKALVEAILGVA